jgi:hypothetical protein
MVDIPAGAGMGSLVHRAGAGKENYVAHADRNADLRRVRSELAAIRVVDLAAEPTLVAYPADRKIFPFRSRIWLPSDYGATT